MNQDQWKKFLEDKRPMIPIEDDTDYKSALKVINELAASSIDCFHKQAYLDFQAAMIHAYLEENAIVDEDALG